MAQLETILTDDQLTQLRGGYDRAAMNAGAKYSMATNRFPKAGDLVDGVTKAYFPTDPDSEDDADWRFFPVHVRDAAKKAAKKGSPSADGQPVPLQLDMASRELVLIPILAANAGPFQLAMHIYWGLMEGLTPRAIANALLLTSWYQGIETWSGASATMEQTLGLLQAQCEAGKVTSTDVVVAISTTFSA